MAEASVRAPQPDSKSDRLESWKEIAAYLNRDVTTVQRWEKREGMPVHRHQHDRMGSVFAFRSELDSWWQSRKLRVSLPESGDPILAAPPKAKPLRPILAVALLVVVAGLAVWFQEREVFWRNPIANARFQVLTDFDGVAQAAAISRDGQFVAFLSDRDGQMDVWVTQLGSGQFHNLTRGRVPELVNPSIRTLGFSPDSSLVTFWSRKSDSSSDISIWAVPTLGGEPRPYLEGAAEFDWSGDGSLLVYHTPGPGDPTFVSEGARHTADKPIFTAPQGLHSHFPFFSPDNKFVYFVHGALPDKLDIWRIHSNGGTPERITSQNAAITFPVLLGRKTLAYLATNPDASGPWIYALDLNRGNPHRLTFGPERYTSLSASADGRRLVATIANPKRSLWRLQLDESSTPNAAASPISLTTTSGFSPRLGAGFLLYVSSNADRTSIWKLANNNAAEIWSGQGEIIGGPALSRDGQWIAFSIMQKGQPSLQVIQNDGTNARVVTSSLNLQGELAWAPDGQSIVSAVNDQGTPHIFRIPIDGSSPQVLVREYSLDPVWSPDGSYLLYSGPDIGTTFEVKAISSSGSAMASPTLKLTRGARRLVFLPRGRKLLFLRGDISHKSLWLLDLEKGTERQLTNFDPKFDIHDFDVSADGTQIVVERLQSQSDVVLMNLQ
ncbi:MAG TPA: hypothetical protein VN577_16410 [Terriglobales bacterium]|nr:hypothetical protein [Terriglobales bacterium]